MTRSARALGTLAYMPPEQSGALRSESGPHSDIYSLEATRAHVLTGRPPRSTGGDLGHLILEDGGSRELAAIAGVTWIRSVQAERRQMEAHSASTARVALVASP